MAEPDGVPKADVQNLLAREEIRQLPHLYAAAIETRDIEAMATLFVPHARFGDYGDGHNGLRRLMSESVEASVFVVILVANHLIELEGEDRAAGQVWAQCVAQTRDGFIEQLLKYEDRYEKYEGRWRFVQRRHRLYYGVRRLASPLAQRAADWPQSQTGVGDLPLADPVFAEWWRAAEIPAPKPEWPQ
ncbi:nuclear transport factor 2 family protein [Mycobacterium sp. 94-17]|uniref:nuclear transport factor 2 family protein n=1 Tax=Mycobacterium sp. 94-17 TaxID=2986147 RepID=UPI002D1EF1A2|nr:nuclear transport factor 2 family protein [Mycobacterium sp. 94-17]MEB4212153.1 nuclear transport factor 2 family protein [Mycobacterium sp. 94-17]